MTLFDYANIRNILIVCKYFKEKITHKIPPYFSCFTDLFEYIRTLTTTLPNPDAPSHSTVEFQLDLLWGQTSSETDDRHQLPPQEGVDRPRKKTKFCLPKKSRSSFPRFFGGEPTSPFPTFFPKTFPRNEHEIIYGKSRVQPKRIDPPRQASTLSSSRT